MNMRSVLTAAVLALASFSAHGSTDATEMLKPGAEAPSFSLPALQGQRVALSVWCGEKLSKPYINDVKHTVILSFWATYCKPCRKEIPALVELGKQWDQPLKIYGISIDKEGASKVRPFVKEQGWDVPILLDPYARTAVRYGVKAVPALFVIDPDGVIRYAAKGFEEGTDLVGLLKNVLADVASGTTNAVDVVEAGESVEAQSTAAPKPVTISPKMRWQAAARVECGEDINMVADELSVEPQTIRTWYEQLKKAALTIWDDDAE